jgi:hypothetical protein
VVCDPAGYLDMCGITTRRPRRSSGTSLPTPESAHVSASGSASGSVPGATPGSVLGSASGLELGSAREGVGRDVRRGGILELQISATDVHRLLTAKVNHPAWARVIEDILTQHATMTAPPQATEPAADPGDVAAGVAAEAAHAPAGSACDEGGQASRRLPGAGLRRLVQIRDRRCVHPTCRAPATRTDIDHTVDHALGDVGPAMHDRKHLAGQPGICTQLGEK